MAHARKFACGALALLAACSDRGEQSDREHPLVTAPRVASQGGHIVVRLDPTALQRAGIRIEAVRRGTQPETTLAFATVVDVQPLIQLSASLKAAQAQLKTAQAKLAASRAEYERERQLFEDQQTVSASRVQSSQAAFLTGAGRTRRTRGPVGIGGCARRPAPGGTQLPVPVGAGSGAAAGRQRAVRLATGRSVEAASIPASALVWWQGRAWVFIRAAGGDFERREVPVERLDAGSLQANLAAGTEVVVQGA